MVKIGIKEWVLGLGRGCMRDHLLLFIGSGWVFLFVSWVFGCFFSGGWVGDGVCEIVVSEGVVAHFIGHEGGVVGWAEIFEVGGEGSLLGLDADGEGFNFVLG